MSFQQDSLATGSYKHAAKQQLQLVRYWEWLSAQSRRNTPAAIAQEIAEYGQNAGKAVRVGNRDVMVFAPFRPEHSALKTFAPWQIAILCVLVLAWGLGLLLFRQGTLVTTISILIVLYTSHLGLNIILTFKTLRRPTDEQIDDAIVHALQGADWPPYTILCPLYREAQVVPQFVRAMQSLSYPAEKLQILFLTEQDDVETRTAIRALSLPPHFKIVTVPEGSPRTKPRACNYGLTLATGQYVVIYDAEDIPEPLQLKKAILTFANHGPNLACVQAKLNFYNPQQNLLTRWFTAEYSLWFDLILPGLQQVGLSIPLGGTSNHFPTQMLRALGAWDAFNVTEDCDLGLRLARYKLDTVILNSVTYEEANSQIKNWIRQRSRWIKGYLQTYLVNMRQPSRYLHAGGWREFLSLQLVIGSKMVVLFLNPLLWLSFALYLAFHSTPGVDAAYHALFPRPLLYIGTFSLIFGNFFHLYIYLLACVRRKHYALVKWALLIPIYWAMMSAAAFMAFWQLIVKPHYWEKTIHGLHLRGNNAVPDIAELTLSHAIENEPTMPMPSLSRRNGYVNGYNGYEEEVPSVTASLLNVMTLPMPAISRAERASWGRLKRTVIRDPWLFLTLLVAVNVSLAAFFYYFQQHDILLYNDAYSHLRVARRILDGAGISLAQFGGVWLPLPHALMLPFVWNDYLWQTGLAGSIPSMVCYIVATVYLFLSIRLLTKDSRASFVGTLVFILNPNVLYLQATPLSELACFATLSMACYYFLRWVEDNQPKYLAFAAGSTFFATLARYDGWWLYLTLLCFVGLVGWRKRQRWRQIEGNMVLFGLLGGLGIGLWLLWDALIFGDPLYFQHGPYSSQEQQLAFLRANTLYTYHDLLQSFRYYTQLSIDTLGPIIFVLAALAVVNFASHHRSSAVLFGALAFLTPLVCYIVSLYTGQVVLYVPETVPDNALQHLYNARFGAEMVPPAALFLGYLACRLRFPTFGRFWEALGQWAMVILIITQVVLVTSSGVVSLQDGQYGVSCAPHHDINVYLAQHYTGGKILEDIYVANVDGTDVGIDLKNFVSESSGQAWNEALRNPAAKVDWIIMSIQNTGDLVTQHIQRDSPTFLRQFALVVQEPTGLQLYYRVGGPPLANRPVPQALLTQHSLCGAGGS